MSCPTPQSPWPGLTRPPSAIASANARQLHWRADARRLGGRLEGGHGKNLCSFKHIKIYNATIFPSQNSYLYGVDDLERPHAPSHSRHRCRGGACANDAREIAEQFCCQRSELRQSQGCRRASRQHERLPARCGHRGMAVDHGRSSTVCQRRAQTARDDRYDAKGGHRSQRSRRLPSLDRATTRTAFVSGGAQ